MAGRLIDPETQEPTEAVIEETETETSDYSDVADEVTEEVNPEVTEEELPEKYKGKTIADIARMHTEAEKALGRQSNEVGELRQAFDEFVTSSVAAKNEPPPEEEVDFFLDPDKAVDRAISNHPKLKQAEAVTAEMKKQASLNKLQSEFPNMGETLQSPDFMNWVKASPIRQKLFREADQSYDYDSAAELFNNWGARASIAEKTVEVEKKQRSQDIKNASTGSTRGNPEGRRTKKVFRRTDLIKLMKTDPSRYESMSDEIMAAYAEGRVK